MVHATAEEEIEIDRLAEKVRSNKPQHAHLFTIALDFCLAALIF
jgi:hypothetical protein